MPVGGLFAEVTVGDVMNTTGGYFSCAVYSIRVNTVKYV